MDEGFENIRYISKRKQKIKKKKPLWRRIVITLSAIVVSFLVLFIVVLHSVTPIIVAYAEAKIKSKTLLAVNNAIFDVMSSSVRYNDLITVTKDDKGSIRLITANTQLINRLALETAQATSGYLEGVSDGIGIPLGTMTGFAALAGRGPDIMLEAIPSSSVVVEFLSEFQQAGINQTRHKIYLEVLTLVVLVLPANRIEVFSTVQVLIAESIIIGEVPSTFLNVSTLGGTMYDLTPK